MIVSRLLFISVDDSVCICLRTIQFAYAAFFASASYPNKVVDF